MDKLTIANIARGALAEQFDVELEKVLDNVLDPNTEAKKPRKIQITVEIKPNDEKRGNATVKVTTKSTIIPSNSLVTMIVIGKDKEGNIEAAELGQEIYGQMEIKDNGAIEESGNVVNYKRNM